MTIEERADAYCKEIFTHYEYMKPRTESLAKACYIDGATEQKEIDEANPSDAVIMRVLNAIGYEEESWIPFVRKNLKNNE